MDRKKINDELDDRLLEKLYDIIRYVNPVAKSTNEKVSEFIINASEVHCFSIMHSKEVCNNCISMRALNENKIIMKFEYSNGKLYLITAVPEAQNNRVLELIRDVTEEHLLENIDGLSDELIIEKIMKLNKEIITDSLTGLYNRRFLEERMPFEIAKAVSNKLPISVVMTDIDFFKVVNDTHGHVVGDQVLKEFSNLLMVAVRDDKDWVVRYGGEEFLIFLHAIDRSNLLKRVEKIREMIESHVFCKEEQALRLTASFGVYTQDVSDNLEVGKAMHFIQFADMALYIAKNNGRNRTEFY